METRSIPVFVVLLIFITSEVGGDMNATTDPYSDGSNQNGDSSLCRVVRDTRKSVLTSFSNQYNTLSGSFCDIYDHCTNVTCTAVFSRGKVNAGLLLKMCEEDPELLYWVDIPGQWDQPWNHTFPSKNMSGMVQRAEITGNPGEVKPTKWYIKLVFSITQGRNNINQAIKYITIQSTLQICQSDSNGTESTCTNTTLLNFPRLPQSQICEFPELTKEDIADSSQGRGQPAMLQLRSSSPTGNYPLLSSTLTSTRSSRNANSNPWDPEQLHRQAQERAKKYQNGEPLKATPGDSCDQESIFDCGPGATCLISSDGSGKCQCLSGYRQATLGGLCEKLPAPSPPGPSDDPAKADSLNSRSYSSAVGAIISILVLVAIAAAMYFGTKYNYFARIRHRLPVFRCWPFRRRSQSWEDNVTMVNPLGNSDDDDPLLL